MGLFSRKQRVCGFDLNHYPATKELVFTPDTKDQSDIALAFLFYMDKILFNVGNHPVVYLVLQSMGMKAHEIVDTGSFTDDSDGLYRVVQKANDHSTCLKADVDLIKKGNRFFVETHFNAVPDIETIVLAGCNGLFRHIAQSHSGTSAPTAFASAIQFASNAYETEGIPSARSLGAIPMLAFGEMASLISQND